MRTASLAMTMSPKDDTILRLADDRVFDAEYAKLIQDNGPCRAVVVGNEVVSLRVNRQCKSDMRLVTDALVGFSRKLDVPMQRLVPGVWTEANNCMLFSRFGVFVVSESVLTVHNVWNPCIVQDADGRRHTLLETSFPRRIDLRGGKLRCTSMVSAHVPFRTAAEVLDMFVEGSTACLVAAYLRSGEYSVASVHYGRVCCVHPSCGRTFSSFQAWANHYTSVSVPGTIPMCPVSVVNGRVTLKHDSPAVLGWTIYPRTHVKKSFADPSLRKHWEAYIIDKLGPLERISEPQAE